MSYGPTCGMDFTESIWALVWGTKSDYYGIDNDAWTAKWSNDVGPARCSVNVACDEQIENDRNKLK